MDIKRRNYKTAIGTKQGILQNGAELAKAQLLHNIESYKTAKDLISPYNNI